jgi:hypothetical protein
MLKNNVLGLSDGHIAGQTQPATNETVRIALADVCNVVAPLCMVFTQPNRRSPAVVLWLPATLPAA